MNLRKKMEDSMMSQKMNLRNICLLILAIFSLSMLSAQTPFTTWDFEASNLNPSTTGTLTVIGGATYEFITGYTGTGTGGLALQTTGYPEQGQGNQTAGIQAMVSTAGRTNIVITWHQRNSNTAANRFRLQYTLNGTVWNDFEATNANASNINTISNIDSGFDNGLYIIDAGATWFSRSANFTSIPQANNNPNFGIRLVSAFMPGTSEYSAAGGGAYGVGGTYRYDNLTFNFTDANTVLAPVFNPNGGIFAQPVQVSITSDTPDAQIFYTTDGTDPSNASTIYTDAITVSQTTTLKAIAYKAGMAPSDITSATFNFTTPISSIALLRQQNADNTTIYQLTSEAYVTFTQSFRYQKFIQDASAAILIDDYSHVITTNYNIGDGVTGFTGKLSAFNGMLQFIPTLNPGPASSTQNVINPVLVTVNDLINNFENFESKLVVLQNIQFVNAPYDTFAVGTIYPVTDGTNNFNFRTTFYDADYIGELVPTQARNVVCIPHERLDNNIPSFYIASRSLADFIPVSNENEILAPKSALKGNYPNPFNPSTSIAFSLENNELVTIQIYNAKGQKVKTLLNENKNAGNHSITWNGSDDNGNTLSSGIYFIKLATPSVQQVKKAILMK